MKVSDIRFGTDGWRAVIGETYTFSNLRRAVQAASNVWKRTERARTVAVGYDTRFLSQSFARATAEVLAGNGLRVLLSDGPLPTTAVSLAIRQKKLAGGLVVTASHNPPEFNGLKVKASFAGPADPEQTSAIESEIDARPVRSLAYDEALKRRRIVLEDLNTPYVKFLERSVDLPKIRRSSFRVLINPMHGVSAPIFSRLLCGGRLGVTLMNEKPDVTFGGTAPEPIPRNSKDLIERMRRRQADVGIGIDGDADRIGAVLPGGRFLYPSEIISLLALHLVSARHAQGSMVKTISGSVLINRVARSLGRRVYETPIGYKHICELQRRSRVLIGGEESGGIGATSAIPERDGILSALLLLEMMAARRQTISKIFAGVESQFGKLSYARRDVACTPRQKKGFYARLLKRPFQQIDGSPVAEIRSYDGVKFIAEDESWLLVRFSGTEPVLRVYVESSSPERVERILRAAQARVRAI